MIYDTLNHLSHYVFLGPRFALGLSYLERFDPTTAEGRVTLDGDNVYALVQGYVPTPASQRPFEAHRLFADLQLVVIGEEIIHYSPLAQLRETTPYSSANDSALYAGDDDFPLYMRPGAFAILLPQDGHKPGCLWRMENRVKKVVVKVRL